MLGAAVKPVVTPLVSDTSGTTPYAGGPVVTGSAPCASGVPCRQEAERDNAAVCPVRSERDTGHGEGRDPVAVQCTESDSVAGPGMENPERNTGRDHGI